jgi:hypothetical protein
VNELAALKEGALYSWAQLSPVEFAVRIGGLWLLFFLLLGGPIAAGSFEPTREPLKFVLAGGAGSLFAVAVLLLRMYLVASHSPQCCQQPQAFAVNITKKNRNLPSTAG